MKSIHVTIAGILICLLNNATAQNIRFLHQGVIEYEKKVNMYALIKRNLSNIPSSFFEGAFDMYKRNQPQFKVQKSVLNFSGNKTLYTPIDSKTVPSNDFFSEEPSASQHNIIFTDLVLKTSITQKKVYEELFLIKDKARKITWKITDEKREIAGYNCRRANGIMLDSIYVVAFYTDRIPVPGGPESFSGLPGMILGVALPHENITWFATKITDTPVTADAMQPPVKGKATDLAGFIKVLGTAIRNWGDYANAAMKGFML